MEVIFLYISKEQIYKEKQKLYQKHIFPINYLKYHKYLKKVKHTNQKFIQENINNPIFDNVNGYSLDEEQRKIILKDEDALIIAGAGTGKTLTIIGKIIYLVKKGIPQSEILCLSLTNDACDNINDRCKKHKLGVKAVTFHKLSLNILKHNGIKYICSTDDSLKDIIHRMTYFNNKTLKLYTQNIFVSFNNKGLTKNDKDIYLLQKHIFFASNLYINLKNKIHRFITIFKSNNMSSVDFDYFIKDASRELNLPKRKATTNFLALTKNIYKRYNDNLSTQNKIDFNDMINLALGTIKTANIKKYKYIIVDEYQDISPTKCELLKALKAKTGAKIIAVGDDFQSIYKFTGSNLKPFLDFKTYFPYSETFFLNKTYRNSQNLLDISGNFIMKNPHQIKKELASDKENLSPINIYYYDKDIKEVIEKVIYDLPKGTVMFLGRNNKDIKDIKLSKQNIKYLTVHKSKGLESDSVIITNLINKVDGFPSRVELDDVFKYVTELKEEYPYAEERRLFYVALTRTKNSNYLLVNKQNPSIFVEELLENKNVTIKANPTPCSGCGTTLYYKVKDKALYYECKKCQKLTKTHQNS